METPKITRATILVGFGLIAGLVGTAVMTISQKVEMRLTKRDASSVPAKAIEKIADLPPPRSQREEQLSTVAHFAFGTSLGVGLAALARIPEPARGLAFFAGAWGAGTGLITGLGVSDPPNRWSVQALAVDLGHHAVYAASAAAAFFGLRRLAHI